MADDGDTGAPAAEVGPHPNTTAPLACHDCYDMEVDRT